ncbi:hypothetical protein [Dactylosporangium sp. NPDC000521]
MRRRAAMPPRRRRAVAITLILLTSAVWAVNSAPLRQTTLPPL